MTTLSSDSDARRRRIVVASTLIGATVEWYDFFIFGIASALFLNKLFFPAFDPRTGSLLAFMAFATGWIARPIGGIIAGHIGDRIGRKTTLYWSFILMGVSSTLIGLLPTYETAGATGAILLVLLRILQGLSAGGEYGGAVITLVEHAKKSQRVLFGTLSQMGTLMGLLLGNFTFFTMSQLNPDALFAWGWRVPFLLSSVMLLLGVYIRAKMEESPEFQKTQREGRVEASPLMSVIRHHPGQLLAAVLGPAAPNTFFYVCVVFMVSYGTKTLGFTQTEMLGVVCLGAFAELITLPFFGTLADRVGRRKVLAGGLIFLAFAAIPFFMAAQTRSIEWLALGYVMILGIGHSAALAVVPAFLADMFPTAVRYTGLSAAYQTSGAIFAGPLPIIATVLIAMQGGSVWLFAGYTMLIAAISLIAVVKSVPHHSLQFTSSERRQNQRLRPDLSGAESETRGT
ncbi:MFS transporter [Caballeronia sp. GAWG1-1]|uniref:MFS transporter n=1 Tax=Caballeronia sp. GAWG1-1 TaxID=2921742 RepID=UPI002027E95D|nr:MFS transporter [Caballeronia sp. GAWG1-1]